MPERRPRPAGSRDKYVDVGAAMRQAIERANSSKLSDGEHQVFDAVLALTAGFCRLWDFVYVAHVRQKTGATEETRLHEVTVRRYLLSLAQRRILEWEPQQGTDAKGKGFRSRLGLPAAEQTERDQTEPQGQTERDRGSVSSGGQTERTLGDRVEQTALREEDRGVEGSYVDAARAREADGEQSIIAQTEAAILRAREIRGAPTRPKGVQWEPDA